MLADSMCNQTFQDYELIVVDDCVKDRSESVRQYLTDNNVKVSYVGKSKPKCFPGTRFNFLNAWNTGVLVSTGDLLLFIQDYTWLSPQCLEKWLKHEELFEKDYAIAGIANYWIGEPYLKKDLTHPISIWEKHWKGTPKENGWTGSSQWIGSPFEMFYVAMSYELLVKLNGFSEYYDCNPSGYVTQIFPKDVKKIGGETYTDKENICDMVNHRPWNPGPWSGIAFNPYGNTVVDERENCFNLKYHTRGDIN